MNLAQGHVVIFLDDDRLTGPDFLLQHTLRHRGDPCLVHGNTKQRIHTHRHPPLQREEVTRPETLPPRVSLYMERGIYRQTAEAFHRRGLGWIFLTAGNSSALRERVEAVGGFDEDFRGWGFEDNDLALRLQESGLPLRFEPVISTLHQVHPAEPTKAADHQRNMHCLFRKHPGLNRPALETAVHPQSPARSMDQATHGSPMPDSLTGRILRPVFFCCSPAGMRGGRGELSPMTQTLEQYRAAQGPLPEKIKRWHLYGAGLESLEEVTIDLPAYGPDELLVRHDACGICFSDIKIINLGPQHPRLQGRDMAAQPVVMGHEVALTVVGVGDNLRGQFQVGRRFIVQADVYYHGANPAYGYQLDGGMAQYGVVTKEVLQGDEGCYLLPLQGDTGYVEAALVEPWACVVAAYAYPNYRDGLLAGGRLLIVHVNPDLYREGETPLYPPGYQPPMS